MGLHAGIDAAIEKYKGFVKRQASGLTASGLLKGISHYELLKTLYFLKNIFLSLAALSKTFQTESLNFSRMSPAISRCKSKTIEVEKDVRVLQQLKVNLAKV